MIERYESETNLRMSINSRSSKRTELSVGRDASGDGLILLGLQREVPKSAAIQSATVGEELGNKESRTTMTVEEAEEPTTEPNGGRNVCVHNEEERRKYERRRSDNMDIRQKARLYDQLMAAMEKGAFNQEKKR